MRTSKKKAQINIQKCMCVYMRARTLSGRNISNFYQIFKDMHDTKIKFFKKRKSFHRWESLLVMVSWDYQNETDFMTLCPHSCQQSLFNDLTQSPFLRCQE